MALIAEADRARVARAITEAELGTSGEIVAVIAAESENFLWLPLLVAGVVALFVPWPLIFLTWMTVESIYLIQLVVFAGVFLLFLWRPLRYAAVPRTMKNRAAHRRAVEQFLAQNLHTTQGRTGVLIYVSVAERYAEILADTAIHEKVSDATWQGIITRLTSDIGADRSTDGFIYTIQAVGRLLAEHFPPGGCDSAALPDRLIVLE